MLSTMLRGLAFGYWLPAIRMPQDNGPRVSGGQGVLPRVHTSIAVPSPIPGGETPSPGGSKSARHLRIPLIHPKSASGFPADL